MWSGLRRLKIVQCVLARPHDIDPSCKAGLCDFTTGTCGFAIGCHSCACPSRCTRCCQNWGVPWPPLGQPSGKISPTTVDHVIAGLDGRINAVVDGGACEMGVESTIISLLDDPVILRPGNITIEDIQTVLGTDIKTLTDADTITAPGQLTSHYAPNASVRLNATEFGPMKNHWVLENKGRRKPIAHCRLARSNGKPIFNAT